MNYTKCLIYATEPDAFMLNNSVHHSETTSLAPTRKRREIYTSIILCSASLFSVSTLHSNVLFIHQLLLLYLPHCYVHHFLIIMQTSKKTKKKTNESGK